MFEAFIVLCTLSASTLCSTVLMPGASADTASACEKLAERKLPHWRRPYFADYQIGQPECTPRPEPKLQFTEIAPGVHVHRGLVRDAEPETEGDLSNIGFIIGTDAIAVIDSGGSRRVGEAVYYAIRQASDLPVSHLILTHMHPDHVFGAAVFAEAGAKIVGHGNLKQALADRRQTYRDNFGRLLTQGVMIGSRIVTPDISVETEKVIDLGNRELLLNSWPLAHSNNDLTVLDRRSGILFTGDLVFVDHVPALDGSLNGWVKVLDRLKALPARLIVPGHGGPVLPWPAGGAAQIRYLDVLRTETRKAIAKGESLSQAVSWVGRSEAGNWALFEHFNPRNATAAYTELEWE